MKTDVSLSKKINPYCQQYSSQWTTSGSRETASITFTANFQAKCLCLAQSRLRNPCPCLYCGQVLRRAMSLIVQDMLPVCSHAENSTANSPSTLQCWMWPVPYSHHWVAASVQDSVELLILFLDGRSDCMGCAPCKLSEHHFCSDLSPLLLS